MDHLPSMNTLIVPDTAGNYLLPIARASIEHQLTQTTAPILAASQPAWVHQLGACFVTLTQAGELRGCIGSLTPHRSLLEDVQANALAAAFHDARFLPLTTAELPRTAIELSILSPIEAMIFQNEADALQQLRPHIDGVILEWQHHRSTFLPQVWEHFHNAQAFIEHLKLKAGLASHFWAKDLRLSRYTVSKWHEESSV